MNERLRTDSQETKIPSSEETQEVPGEIPANRTYVDDLSNFDSDEEATTEEKPMKRIADWNDDKLDFFAAYPDVEVPTESALIKRIEEGVLPVSELRPSYDRALAQYDVLRQVMDQALSMYNITLPGTDTYAMATPLMRRSFEQAISERLKLYSSQFAPAINQLLTRLTLLTELCTVYEDVADVFDVSLMDTDVDSVEKAA